MSIIYFMRSQFFFNLRDHKFILIFTLQDNKFIFKFKLQDNKFILLLSSLVLVLNVGELELLDHHTQVAPRKGGTAEWAQCHHFPSRTPDSTHRTGETCLHVIWPNQLGLSYGGEGWSLKCHRRSSAQRRYRRKFFKSDLLQID